MPETLEEFTTKNNAGIGDNERRSITETEAHVTIECSLTARGCDFLGVFNIASTNKPTELIFRDTVSQKLTDCDRELPSIAARILGVDASLQK
jgi:hypothetical protein